MDGLVGELTRTALLEVAALFPIVNPVGTAPIFLSLTRGASSRTRTTLATRIALNGFVLLVAILANGIKALKLL
jgi:multiple antibiotic resistance protein